MENGTVQSNESGTPQGSGLSPLLANIALHGIEHNTKEHLRRDLFIRGKQKYNAKNGSAGNYLTTLSIIRYADDFVVLHESKEIILKAKEYVTEWLMKIGLELNLKKPELAIPFMVLRSTI